MENESIKTINLYEIKNNDNISVISDITEIVCKKDMFELIEVFQDRRKLKYIYKELSFEMYNTITKREEVRKSTKEEKKESYMRVKKYSEYLLNNKLKMKQIYVQNECYRYYTKSKMSLQNLPNEIRGFLCEGEMTDIDIRNGQPVIINMLCKRYEIECPYLDKYVRERESILEKTKMKKIDYII